MKAWFSVQNYIFGFVTFLFLVCYVVMTKALGLTLLTTFFWGGSLMGAQWVMNGQERKNLSRNERNGFVALVLFLGLTPLVFATAGLSREMITSSFIEIPPELYAKGIRSWLDVWSYGFFHLRDIGGWYVNMSLLAATNTLLWAGLCGFRLRR